MRKALELIRVSDRIWYSTFEEERDRPCLGYVRGSRWSLAVDAGHSDAHVDDFYAALEKAHLPLPSVTVLTHWHWDHALGMHHISGLSAANVRTDRHLRKMKQLIAEGGEQALFSLDPSIAREYEGNRPAVVSIPDIVFDRELTFSPGDVSVKLITCTSPHTDDSTLVYIPGERFLFVGDAICGTFPTWEKDPEKAGALAEVIGGMDVDSCLGGHWPLMNKRALIEFLNSWE